MGRAANIVAVVDRLLTAVLDGFVIVMAALLFGLMNYAVYTRFIRNASVSWGEELPAYCLAALTFIGAAYLTRTNEHLGFDGAIRALPAGAQKVLLAVNLFLMGVFGMLLAYYGGLAALSFGGRQLISVDLPIALFRAAMPLGGALIALFCFARLAGLCLGHVAVEDLLPESDA